MGPLGGRWPPKNCSAFIIHVCFPRSTGRNRLARGEFRLSIVFARLCAWALACCLSFGRRPSLYPQGRWHLRVGHGYHHPLTAVGLMLEFHTFFLHDLVLEFCGIHKINCHINLQIFILGHEDQRVIAEAMQEYHKNTCIHFVPRKQEASFISIGTGAG